MRKSYRVKSEQAFSHVFHHGRNQANRQFVIYALTRESSHFRVGISVGKRIGNAVARNQMKRRIRQALTELKPYIQPNADFIVIARKPAATLDQAGVKASLIHVMKRAHLFAANPPRPETESRREQSERNN